MNRRTTGLMLSVLVMFTMSCSLVTNLLGKSEPEMLKEEEDALAVEMDVPAEEEEPNDEMDNDAESTSSEGAGDEENAIVDSEEGVEAQPEGSQAGMISSGPCYNPYFPIIENRILVYENKNDENGDWDSSHEMVFRDVVDEQFTAVFRYYETDLEGNQISDDLVEVGITWLCTDEGLQQQEFMFGNFGPVDDLVEISYETAEFQGITFPSEENFVIGATWEADYAIVMQTTVEGVTVTSQVEIHQVNTVVGMEDISVVYGDFTEAMRVDSVLEMVMTAETENGTSFTLDSESVMSSWYVKDIGMVKQISYEDEAYTYIQELAEIK